MRMFEHLPRPVTTLHQPKVSGCPCLCMASNPLLQLAQCEPKPTVVVQHPVQIRTHNSEIKINRSRSNRSINVTVDSFMSEAHVDYRWRQLIWGSLCPVSTLQRLPLTRSPTALLRLPLPAATCMAQPQQTPVPSSMPASNPTERSVLTHPSLSLSMLPTWTGWTSQRMASTLHRTSQVGLIPCV